MSESPLLVFDFDGVICNSIHDSMMTGLNTYTAMVPDHNLPLETPLRPEEVAGFESSNPEFFQYFSELMPLGRRAEDYFIIIGIIDRGEAGRVKGQSDFDGIKANIPSIQLDRFQNAFYKTRLQLAESDPAAWSALFPPFEGVNRALEILTNRFRFAIATAKDRTSVHFQLKAFHLMRFFDDDMIFDKDFAAQKRDALIAISRNTSTDFSDIHFIDDKLNHLMGCLDLGIHCYLAAWGFNSEREHRSALSAGITLLALEDLPKLSTSCSPDRMH
jgi:phosphoglycolate phosphatase-like HAD superfamily hydrolase